MNKTIIGLMVAMLLVIGGALAVSDITYTVTSPSGNVDVVTNFQVGGYDAQTSTTQMTSNDHQYVSNTGTLSMVQTARTYGTGLAWPDRNAAAQGYGDNGAQYGEWSGKQMTSIATTGATYYERQFTAWTVHPTWWTGYEGNAALSTPTTLTDQVFEGNVQGAIVTAQAFYDNTAQAPYENYQIGSYSFVNPFNGASAFGATTMAGPINPVTHAFTSTPIWN